ncbi:endonuclease/exonuclease/phosphatase family protein [Dysgonomonas sp. Marseille-P4677]|uniref:endonuclease/exonuclease/phosphatase family protein n=1 Tax=Dysgonomonas sp. Marseille-P4677 TaxID=2364790 RepID=UPI0019137965|nr:endonuclease/exonuclease/phosphatase family protein [Dysgonomonas sp. Marseille-P4677]MBK5721953.1 endonuclease/exonuclease/phosphatase family protein [Dysgonomonas sp. Marseille-P4677]
MKKIKYILLAILLCTTTLICAQKKENSPLRVASYNLRMDTPSDSLNAWPNRKEMVNDLIRFHGLDVIGTQEGFIHQIRDIVEQGDFAYVGVGRDDGAEAGEHSAIIYKKSRLTVMDKGNFWFSETPEKPSYGWDATIKRICSWAKFKDNTTGKEFYFFALHYDHRGVLARKNSSLLLLKKVREIAKASPVIVTGDFNAKPEEEPMKIIFDDNYLLDSKKLSSTKPYGTTGTYSGFKVNAAMTSRIDFILVNSNIKVSRYGVLNDMQYGRFPSDHFPVVADLTIQ